MTASPGAVYAGGGMDSMLPALTRDIRERDVPMLVALRWERMEFMFSWLRLRLPGGILRGCGMASDASMVGGGDAGPASSPLPDGGAWRSGDLGGSDGGGDLPSALFPTGVGGRRGRELRPAGLLGADDETDGGRVADNGGRGGSGGNLDDVGAEYAADLGGSSFIFLMRSMTLRARALAAAWRSA